MTQLTYFESPKNGLPCTVVDPLGCHFVLYKVGWKLWSWLTSRRESFSTLTLTYMHSITELSHWKKTSSWIEKSDPDQGKSLTSWLFRCQKDQNFLTRSYVSKCTFGSRVSPVEQTSFLMITLTYMHSITELSNWKKPSSYIKKSDPDQWKSLTSWLFRCQKDQNFLTRSYVSRCSLGSRVSPVDHTKKTQHSTEMIWWNWYQTHSIWKLCAQLQ